MFDKIKHITYTDIHGVLEATQPFEEIILETFVGPLIPVYKIEDQGRKKLTPVKFYPEGRIKSLQLQEGMDIETSIGVFSTEFITFYPSGEMCRLFQLNGKLSGYWSEENEYNLAESMNIPSPIGDIFGKPMYVHFYETGQLKSITYWPQESVLVESDYGTLNIKTGISFYPCGSLKSYEPSEPIIVSTPIGNIEAYDPDPMGINGEQNSLKFKLNTDILALSTIKSEVIIINGSGYKETYSPQEVSSRCSDEKFVVQPLKIEFADDKIIFRHGFKIVGSTPKDSVIVLQDFIPSKELVCEQCCS